MADQKTILPLGAAAQADNDKHRLDYMRPDQYDQPVRMGMSAQQMLAVGVVGGAIGLVVLIVLAAVQGMTCWGVSAWMPSTGCTLARGVFWFYVMALATAPVCVLCFFLYGYIMRLRAEYARATLTRDRWSNPVSAAVVHRQTLEQNAAYFAAAADAEIRMAPYKMLPAGLDAYSVSNSSQVPNKEEDDEALITLLPPSEWLTWFDTRPHGLLAAETGGGKSTTFKAIVKSRIEAGESIFLIDPHSSDWFGLPSIGGGEDWDAVWCGMRVVIGEYGRRMQERDDYLKRTGAELPHDYFPRITVLLDEANTACRKLSIGKRGQESKWDQFTKALGSGARKVGISIQMLAQSPNVEDLELSGPMRQNFTRLCLDAATTRLMVEREEKDVERKRALFKALENQEYPATANRKGQVVLLDRTGLNHIAAPHDPRAALWIEGYEEADRLIAFERPRSVVSAQTQTRSSAAAASMPVPPQQTQTDAQTGKMQPDRKKALLRYMRAQGMDRDAARAELRGMGEGLDNDDWTDAK